MDRYLEDAEASACPSPLRWLWLALLALTIKPGQRTPTIVAAALCPLALGWAVLPALGSRAALLAMLIAATSPLLWTMGRRALQDAPVALAVILTSGFALRHSPIGFALSVFALLGLKEAAVVSLPALAGCWLFSDGHSTQAAGALLAAIGAWALVTRLLLGPRAAEVFARARRGHQTTYTREHQRGGLLRLCADLFVVSPAAVLCATRSQLMPLTATALLLIACHALAPVVNVRFVLAAELLLRAAAAAVLAAISPVLLAPLVLIDAVIAWRMRRIYDPITSALTHSFGMTP